MPSPEELEFERTPLAPGSLLQQGMYRVERLLGAGGFALVYLARQGRWNLQVCLKEFYPFGCQRGPQGLIPEQPESARRIETGLRLFQDEAQALSRFQHPGIVRVLGSFSENQTVYLVQELLEGMTLSEGLEMAGRMPESMVLQVAQQVGQALLMVHAAGLVHADLKPENIFLTREGRYVLLDFGLTRSYLSRSPGQAPGTGLSSGYSPPEQYIPGAQLTPATDLYGFASTLFTLLTGHPLPDALSRSQGLAIPPIKPSNPSVTPKVERALLRALDLDQQRRTQGVREFLHQLDLDSTPRAISYRPAPIQLRSNTLAHSKGVMTMALHGPSGRLYTGARQGILRVWRWPEIIPIHEEYPHDRHLHALAVSHDGKYLASGTEAGEVKVTPTDFSRPGALLYQEASPVTSLSFHRDWVAASFVNGKCCLMGPQLEQPSFWIAHAGPAYRIEFHPQGTSLVTCGEDGLIRLWDLPEPKILLELKGHEKGVNSVRFSPDGSSLLSSSNDHSVKFWDLESGQIIRDLRSHASVVFDARFTHQPDLVVSLAGDQLLRGLSLPNARLAYTGDAPTERYRTLVSDLQRNLVATSAGDGHIRLWELDERHWVRTKVPSCPEAPQAGEEAGLDPWLGQHVGPYLLEDILGEGGMATVYRASRLSGSETQVVALKLIRPELASPEYQQRFEREIRVSAQLDHPHLVRILDWGRQDGCTYLAMQLVEGSNLKDLIPAQGMDIQQALPLLQGVVAGLSYAHSLGIVHRDLKPENVMVTPAGQALLMDFGLARDQQVKTVTRLGCAIGTAEYMAPEQVTRGPDRSSLSDKIDQYALGVLFFEVLCGRRPFEWDDPIKLITLHLCQDPPAPSSFRPELPPALDRVLARMLSKQPEARYSNVEEAFQALLAALLPLKPE